MLKQLQRKFVLITMTLLTVMLVVILGLVISFTRENLERNSQQMLINVANEPMDLGFPGSRRDEVNLPYFVIQLSSRGTIRVVSTSDAFDLSDEALLSALVEAVRSSGTQSGLLEDYSLRFWWDQTPAGERFAFVDVTSEQATVAGLVRTCVIIGATAFCVFFFLCSRMAQWAIRPVAQAWDQQKQFVADASHELKTPLTVIMTNAELLQNPESDQEVRQQSASSILTMSRQMRGLVEGLLDLARVDNGAIRTTFTTVDLSTLVSDGLLPFEPLFFERELTLESRIAPDISLKGSPDRLEQVLKILLDNALKYSDPGVVTVTLSRSGNHCLLSVVSPGAPLSPEDQKNIFQRFYRVDKARSRNGSYGLGLSIAAGIVAEHGGRIWAESQSGTNRFRVQLPLTTR